jgi:hypothetical protein
MTTKEKLLQEIEAADDGAVGTGSRTLWCALGSPAIGSLERVSLRGECAWADQEDAWRQQRPAPPESGCSR